MFHIMHEIIMMGVARVVLVPVSVCVYVRVSVWILCVHICVYVHVCVPVFSVERTVLQSDCRSRERRLTKIYIFTSSVGKSLT